MKTRDFTTIIDGKPVEVTVNSPTAKDDREAAKIYNTAFTDALKSKAVVRARLDDLLIDQGLWDDAKQMKFEALQKTILQNEQKLKKGGISLSEAKELALQMRKARSDLRELISVKTNLDNHTAEGQADNAKFNYLISACTFYKGTNNKVYSSYDDYLQRSTDICALQAANNLANMMYGLDNNYEQTLAENEFLREYKFVDEKLRLIDDQGRLIDEQGRLINEKGRLINENGEYVDKFGNLVDEDGEYKVEFTPFLDDQGKPVPVPKQDDKTEDSEEEQEESVEEEEKTKIKAKKRAKKRSLPKEDAESPKD